MCANTGAALHLVHPLGFALDERRLRRAGLDYHEWARVHEHASLDAFLDAVSPPRLYALTTAGSRGHHRVRYRPGDALLFGPESRGLPAAVLARVPAARRLRIPMRPASRSLNLSNAVTAVLYEAWRQTGFAGAC